MARIKSLSTNLLQYELYLIAAVVLAGIIDQSLLAPGLGIAGIFWGLRKLSRQHWSRRTPADLAIFFLVLAAAGSLYTTVRFASTFPAVLNLMMGLALFYSTINWTETGRHIQIIQTGLLLTGSGLGLLAPYGVNWVTYKVPIIPAAIYENFYQILQDPIHHNVMAGYLVVILALLLGWMTFSWAEYGTLRRAGLVAGITVIFSVLVLTQSRGALLALSIVVLALAGLRFRTGWLLTPVLITAGGLLVNNIGLENIMTDLSDGVSLDGWQIRVDIWSRALKMIEDFPITGVGMGLFGDTANALYPNFFSTPVRLGHAHNLFLQVAVDLGIPGLIAWLSIAILVFRRALALYLFGRRKAAPEIAGLGAGLILSQLALFAHGSVDAVTWGNVRPSPLIWGIWGLAFAAGKIYLYNSGEQAEYNLAGAST